MTQKERARFLFAEAFGPFLGAWAIAESELPVVSSSQFKANRPERAFWLSLFGPF